MGFREGVSGNPKGRPKMSDDEKEQREEFKKLLRTATVPALQAIIEISQSKCNKDRFNACKYILDRCFGANAVFFGEDTEDVEPVVIRVIPYQKPDSEDKDEDWEESPDDEYWNKEE